MSSQVSLSILDACRIRAQESEVSLGEAFEELKDSSFYIIVFLLCLPFIQPFSLGPLSTVGGLVLASLGWQLYRGDATPWLPEKVREIRLSEKGWARLHKACSAVLWVTGKIAKGSDRTTVAEHDRFRRTSGVLIVLGGLLMAIPFVGIPLNNTLPAIMMIAAALAALEDSRRFLVIAVVFLVLTLAYFAFLFWGAFHLSAWLLQHVPFL